MTATAKQVNFALSLMGKAGYSTRFMKAEHAALGASNRERGGTVQSWLAGMDRGCRISSLIDGLK